MSGPASDEFVDWLLIASDQFDRYRNDIEIDAEFFSPLDGNIVKIPEKLGV